MFYSDLGYDVHLHGQCHITMYHYYQALVQEHLNVSDDIRETTHLSNETSCLAPITHFGHLFQE
jgi:hypothetical protein